MKLVDEWRWVMQRAWSVRLMVLAGVLSGAEVFIQVALQLGWQPPFPAGMFAAFAGVVSFAALVARLVAQSRD